jgi:hypothetical protein
MMWGPGGEPARFHQGRSFSSATAAEESFVREEISRLLESAAIREARPGEATHVSKAFLVPKGDKFRMIWDGRLLNEATKEETMNFETLKSLKTLAQLGDWAISMDLSDGFHICGIAPEDQRCMAFQCAVTGKTYVYQVLPFGWRLSPYVFCRCMQTLTRLLRSPDVPVTGRGTPDSLLTAIKREVALIDRERPSGSARGTARSAPPLRMRILPYMDDYLGLFRTREEALLGAQQLQTTLSWLGLSANEKKCVWEPTQVLVHLGLVIDLRRGLFLVPKEKEKKLANFARGLILSAKRNRRLISRRQLAVFCGLAQSVYLAVPMSQLYLRSLHDCSATGGRNWDCNVRLTKQALRDLQWWVDLSAHSLGRAMWRSPEQAVLHSDASLFAWGGVLDSHLLAHGLWTAEERRHHITVLELIAVHRNLAAYLPRLKSKTVHLHEDNMAVCYILRRKTSRNPVLMAELRKLWAFADEHEVKLRTISYVRSADNPADAPSRLTGSDSWRIRADVFLDLDRRFGPHTIDRFASSSAHMLPRYNALFADPLAEAQDCFSRVWSEENNWCHPPISDLDQLAQFLRESGAVATVIAPRWTYTSWFQALLEMSVEMVELGTADSVADASYLQQFSLRGPGAWPLVAFRVVPGRLERLAF